MSTVSKDMTDQEFWDQCIYDKSLLADPRMTSLKNNWGMTPLHWAALHFIEALDHPEVALVKNCEGDTPLHLAAQYFKEALDHPEAARVKDHQGMTPKDIWSQMRKSL